MYSLTLSVLFKTFLEWIYSIVERLIQKEKYIEQGRQEVRDAVNKETEKLRNDLKEIRLNNAASLSVDDAVKRLRDRINSNGNGVS